MTERGAKLFAILREVMETGSTEDKADFRLGCCFVAAFLHLHDAGIELYPENDDRDYDNCAALAQAMNNVGYNESHRLRRLMDRDREET